MSRYKILISKNKPLADLVCDTPLLSGPQEIVNVLCNKAEVCHYNGACYHSNLHQERHDCRIQCSEVEGKTGCAPFFMDEGKDG